MYVCAQVSHGVTEAVRAGVHEAQRPAGVALASQRLLGELLLLLVRVY